MFSVKVEVKIGSGTARSFARVVADQTLDALEAFYLQRQGQIPVKTGRLRASLVDRGAADNIAEILDGPRGFVAQYGTRVPYAQYPNVKRKLPRPTAAAVVASAPR